MKYNITEAKNADGRVIREKGSKKLRRSPGEEGYQFAVLLVRYGGGRGLCNCEDAYSTPALCETVGGETVIGEDCDGGCSSNEIDAKYEIAAKALAEIRRLERKIKKLSRKG